MSTRRRDGHIAHLDIDLGRVTLATESATRILRCVFYLKAAGVGALSAVGAAAVYVTVTFAWGVVYLQRVLVPRARGAAEFGSWTAEYPQQFDLGAPLVIGFVLGASWVLLRRKRIHRSTK
jgi:hypothetical protein